MSQLVYQHVHPQRGPGHEVTPKRIQVNGSRLTMRTVCESCDKFVMMVPGGGRSAAVTNSRTAVEELTAAGVRFAAEYRARRERGRRCPA